MGALWVKDGGGVATSGDGKPAVLCDKCPCGEQWSIARICGCYSACDEVHEPIVRLGIAVYLTSVFDPLLSGGVPVRKLRINDHGHEANDGGLVVGLPWSVLTVPIMQKAGSTYEKLYVQAVEFQTPAAPFDGTISAKVYFDGVEDVDARWSGVCAEGVRQYVGSSDWDNAEAQPLLKTSMYFNSPGYHRVSVSVTWTKTGTGEKQYVSAQHVILAHMPCYADDQPLLFEPPLEGPLNIYPGPEDIWIVPYEFFVSQDYISECPWVHETSTLRLGHSAEAVLGPYNTRADAEFVLAHWMGTIASYLRDCHTCISGCGLPFENNADFEIDPPCDDVELIDGDGGTGVPHSCETGWIMADAWSCVVHGGGVVSFRKKRQGGDWEIIGTASDGAPFDMSGYLVEPCSEYKATYSNHSNPPATGVIIMGCTGGAVFYPEEIDCEPIEADFALIPANSAALREWEESQRDVNRILAELPERLV